MRGWSGAARQLQGSCRGAAGELQGNCKAEGDGGSGNTGRVQIGGLVEVGCMALRAFQVCHAVPCHAMPCPAMLCRAFQESQYPAPFFFSSPPTRVPLLFTLPVDT